MTNLSLHDFLTPSDVAKQLGVDRNTVYLWIKEERLPSLKIGGSHRINPRDLQLVVRPHQPRK